MTKYCDACGGLATKPIRDTTKERFKGLIYKRAYSEEIFFCDEHYRAPKVAIDLTWLGKSSVIQSLTFRDGQAFAFLFLELIQAHLPLIHT